MNRLSEGAIELNDVEVFNNCSYSCYSNLADALNKLAEYENVGLQPEHIDSIIEQLLGYLDAEQAGLLIELPCKVGDTVYQINYDRTIENYKVIGFEIDERGQLYVRVLIERPYVATLKLSYRKEDLYFSREEAEKALEEQWKLKKLKK